MKTNNLLAAIASSFMNCGLTSSNIEKNDGRIDIMDRSLEKQEDGSYHTTLTVVMKGDEFEYKEGDLSVTQADVSFDIHLEGCTLGQDEKMVWDANKGGTYTVESGIHTPSIITYNGDKPINDCDNDNFFTGGLTEVEDRNLGVVLAKNVIDWTTNASLNKVLRDTVADISLESITAK